MTGDINTYIKERLDIQQFFFSRKSRINKRCYYLIKTLVIGISVTVPFLLSFFKDVENIKLIIGLLSVILALINSLEVVFKFHENWISSRTTSEALKLEKFLFEYNSGPYHEQNNNEIFVERIEGLLAKENMAWAQLSNQEDKKK